MQQLILVVFAAALMFANPALAYDPCMGMKATEGSFAMKVKRASSEQERSDFAAKQADIHTKRLACEEASAKEPPAVKR